MASNSKLAANFDLRPRQPTQPRAARAGGKITQASQFSKYVTATFSFANE